MDKNIYTLSVDVTNAAMGYADGTQFPAKCKELYDYFYNNPDYIVRDDKLGFHVGSAFYFMGMCLKDKESDKYKFAMLVSFINLYRALQDRDMQACISAYRLFLLIVMDNKNQNPFFDLHITAQLDNLAAILIPCPDTYLEKVSKYKLFIYNYLYQFFEDEGSVALSLLNIKEQKAFRREFERICPNLEKRPDKRSETIQNGLRVINAINEQLIDAIDVLKSFGLIL